MERGPGDHTGNVSIFCVQLGGGAESNSDRRRQLKADSAIWVSDHCSDLVLKCWWQGSRHACCGQDAKWQARPNNKVCAIWNVQGD